MSEVVKEPLSVMDDASWAGLPVRVSVERAHVVVALAGEIDAANAEALPDVVAAELDPHRGVRIDIADVTFFDSSLLRALLVCQAKLAAVGVELKVRNPSPQARRVFELTNTASLIESQVARPAVHVRRLRFAV